MNIIATFVGRVGSVRYDQAQSGPVLTISVAVNHHDGTATWIQSKIWGPRAERLHKHVEKGETVMISGPLGIRSKELDEKTVVDVTCQVREFEFLGHRSKAVFVDDAA